MLLVSIDRVLSSYFSVITISILLPSIIGLNGIGAFYLGWTVASCLSQSTSLLLAFTIAFVLCPFVNYLSGRLLYIILITLFISTVLSTIAGVTIGHATQEFGILIQAHDGKYYSQTLSNIVSNCLILSLLGSVFGLSNAFLRRRISRSQVSLWVAFLATLIPATMTLIGSILLIWLPLGFEGIFPFDAKTFPLASLILYTIVYTYPC